MSLIDLLSARGIRTALIVDDVYDAVPTAADIEPTNESWTNFVDDLTVEQRARIVEEYPAVADMTFDQCVNDDQYVATIWSLREELGEIVSQLFEVYIADQSSDEDYVNIVKNKLEELGLTVSTAGRQFSGLVANADLVIIDLFFSKAQDPDSLNSSKEQLKSAIQPRLANPPIVILMSRSSRLESKREEFRDEVGLLDSGFRILRKDDIGESEQLELLLERLAENYDDSHSLARLFNALEMGITQSARKTLTLLRKLRLSDIGQIQQLLLNAEGEPAGSYLVDVFDRVLQHELEGDVGIIQAAVALNGFSAASHPPPYVSGSADLQELVQRVLTQNENRLQLAGSLESSVAFGDLLRMSPGVDTEDLQRKLHVEIAYENILLVLTPACDLQRGAAPRILLLVGAIKPLTIRDWSYGEDARTNAIRIDGELCWIKWNIKHVDTISKPKLNEALGIGEVKLVGRLREGHALELQQRVLSGLGRVGQMATLPATFPVRLEVFYPDVNGRLHSLEVPDLEDGAVCFAGRGSNGGQMLRLVMTEVVCDGVLAAIANLNEEHVAERAHNALRHIKSSPDLRRLLTQGIDLKGVNDKNWKEIASETGAQNGVSKMGLIAWNYAVPDEPLQGGSLAKSGIIFLIHDAEIGAVPGLGDAMRSGLIESSEISTMVEPAN